MATSRISLNSPDVIDVTAVMEAFEQINKCEITIFGRVETVNGLRSLTFLVSALERTEPPLEPRYLGSVKCHINGTAHRTMETAIMWALYQLDWEVAQGEMRKTDETA